MLLFLSTITFTFVSCSFNVSEYSATDHVISQSNKHTAYLTANWLESGCNLWLASAQDVGKCVSYMARKYELKNFILHEIFVVVVFVIYVTYILFIEGPVQMKIILTRFNSYKLFIVEHILGTLFPH